ncbi:MAG: dTMP kinase [Lactobacillus sp.]|jgi:dTMP kinase
MPGFFISFEGPDGSGKSSVLAQLAPVWTKKMKQTVLLTREPGGSRIAEKIRQLILDPQTPEMTARTEALLYAAQRAQHLQDVVLPALAQGQVVISDRFVDSSLAYQGAGRQLGVQEVATLNRFATNGLQPDLTLLFMLAPAVGLARIQKERPDHEDRLEREKLAFHERVYQEYRRLAVQEPARIKVIDASQPLEQVVADCDQIVRQAAPQLFS